MPQMIELTYEQEDEIIAGEMKRIYEAYPMDVTDRKMSKKLRKASKLIHNWYSKPEDWID